MMAATSAASAMVVSFSQEGDRVTFANADGQWTIYTRCFAGAGNTHNMRAGLGAFAMHFTRGPSPSPNFALGDKPWTSNLTTRMCYATNGRGVYRADVTAGPELDGTGSAILDMTVWVRDQWGNFGFGPDDDGNGVGDAIFKIDYHALPPTTTSYSARMTYSITSGW
jgi:hypothetical protein